MTATDTTVRIRTETREGLNRHIPDLGDTQDRVIAELLDRYERNELGKFDAPLLETRWVETTDPDRREFGVEGVRTDGRDPTIVLDDGREFTAAEFDALRRLGAIRPVD